MKGGAEKVKRGGKETSPTPEAVIFIHSVLRAIALKVMVFILRMDGSVACVELYCCCEHLFIPTHPLAALQQVLGSPAFHMAS